MEDSTNHRYSNELGRKEGGNDANTPFEKIRLLRTNLFEIKTGYWSSFPIPFPSSRMLRVRTSGVGRFVRITFTSRIDNSEGLWHLVKKTSGLITCQSRAWGAYPPCGAGQEIKCTSGTLPKGKGGVKARLYSKKGQLYKASGWKYNTSALPVNSQLSVGTGTIYTGSDRVRSWGEAKVNGSVWTPPATPYFSLIPDPVKP